MKIVIAVFGSLGDMHPMNALGLELKRRGHHVTFATMEFYREKIEKLGFEFRPMRPHFNLEGEANRELAARLMDAAKGSEILLRELILPNLRPMYDDLLGICEGAEMLISTEVVFPAQSVVEKTGIKWVTTSLAPGPLLSAYDPFVPPVAIWFRHLRFLPRFAHKLVFDIARRTIASWLAPYDDFRRSIGLEPGKNPLFEGKSDKLNLAMFSRVLGSPQPDWPTATLQTGFCFYDGGQDIGALEPSLAEFLDAGEPPIVFTLGSAAVMDARDFYEQSAAAAQLLGRRAVLLYGMFNEPPEIDADPRIIALPYAPYSELFPRAACVVHQGGVGTTSQVLRAGVPHVFMPYSHDQPDNAARCERLGVATIISRDAYKAESAARKLRTVLENDEFRANAQAAAKVIRGEHGTWTACDAIEALFQPRG